MTRLMRGIARLMTDMIALAIVMVLILGPLSLFRAHDDIRFLFLYLPIIALFAWLKGDDE